MAAPTLVGIGPYVAGSGSITLSWPYDVRAGDFAILYVETMPASAAPGFPIEWQGASGYSDVAAPGTDPERAWLFNRYRVLTEGWPDPVTISGGYHLSGRIIVFRGVDAADPVVGRGGSSDSPRTNTYSPIISLGTPRLVVLGVGLGAAGAEVSSVSGSPYMEWMGSGSHAVHDGGGLSIYSTVGSYLDNYTINFNKTTDSALIWIALREQPVAQASGATSLQITAAATGRRLAFASAAAAAAVTGSGALRGSAPLAATASAALSPAGTLRGDAVLAGVVALGLAATGGLTGVAPAAGAGGLAFTQAAALTGTGALKGAAAVGLDGAASGVAIPGMGGYGDLQVTATGALRGIGALSGQSESSLTWGATLSGKVPAAGAAAATFTTSANLRGGAALAASSTLNVAGAAVPTGAGRLAGAVTVGTGAMPATLRGNASLSGQADATLTASGLLVKYIDPAIESHWRVQRPRPVILLTIGAPPLPVITPIIHVEITESVDPHVAPELAGPEGLSVIAGLDSAHLAWAYPGPKGAEFTVELAADDAGIPGVWAVAGTTPDLQYLLGGLVGPSWVRVFASLNGRHSSPTVAQPVTPIPSFTVTGNASAIAALQHSVDTLDGVTTAQAIDLVNLDARADALETDVGGLQTQTTALAAADSVLTARVTAAENSITSQSSQLTSLSSSIETTKSVAGRTPTVFRQATAPAISGTRYNLLLQTTALTASPWVRTASVTPSTIADPEGYLQAQRITPTGDGQYVRQDVSGLGSIAGRTFTVPIYIRADTAHTCSIRLVAGTAGTAKVMDVAATNLWKRVYLELEFTTETNTALRVEIYPKQYGSTGQPNLSIDVFGPQLAENMVRPYQRVSVANDYDGNGIPPNSTWYDTSDGNKEYGWQLSGGSMQWVLGADTRIAATAAATSALDTRVSSAEGAITAQASQISSINSALPGKASASAVSALETRVASAEGTITAQSSAITSINSALPGKASASAVSALETRVTTTETGLTTLFAAYTLTLDVNGKISGFKSVNDGVTSSFEVLADRFSVVKPDGGDALTWTGGVLSSKKGSKELKLGAGFGSDAAGQKLLLSYGAPVADASASRTTADMWIAENGDTKLGGFQVNYGSGWKSGAAITYSSTPTTATISVTAGVFAVGSREYSYGASSASVSGSAGTNVTYWLYYDDPGLQGGSRTLFATTDGTVTYNSDSKVVVGAVKVAFPASGSSTGGGSTPGGGSGGGTGGGWGCVSIRAWVIGRAGPMRAGDVCVGDDLLLCDPSTGEECWGEVTYSQTITVPGVRLRAGSVPLTCSTTAPIPTEGGMLLAPDTLGHDVRTRGLTGQRLRTMDTVTCAGVIDAQHITVGDRCFWAGDDGTHYMLHHNLKAPQENQ